jgi:GNAT superfamily N-acetyltransferase
MLPAFWNFGGGMGSRKGAALMSNPTEVELCPVSEWAQALAMLYRRVAGELRESLVREALEEAGNGQLDLSGLWIGRRRGRIVAAMLSQVLAGKAAALWAPEVGVTIGRATLAATLIREAVADMRDRGVGLVQALVDASSPRRASGDFEHAGLPRVTELTYMARDTACPLPPRPGVPQFHWRSYCPETEPAFREVLDTTYIGSLDMPELEGVRALDDILAGHRAGGRFDPARWHVGHLPDEPASAAVVLLGAGLEPGTWEVSYLGLSPSARGRGLGRAAIDHALSLARPHASRLELAVDARNTPAEHLYQRCGFEPFDRRGVHLAVLRRP